MLLNSKQLIGLSVVSEDGAKLGQIKDFEFNADNSQIEKFIITPSGLTQKITRKDLIINKDQVVEITRQQMIVKSSMIKSTSPATSLA